MKNRKPTIGRLLAGRARPLAALLGVTAPALFAACGSSDQEASPGPDGGGSVTAGGSGGTASGSGGGGGVPTGKGAGASSASGGSAGAPAGKGGGASSASGGSAGAPTGQGGRGASSASGGGAGAPAGQGGGGGSGEPVLGMSTKVHLIPSDGVSGLQRVNFALPLQPGQLTNANDVRVLRGSEELKAGRPHAGGRRQEQRQSSLGQAL
jgi:hypothetical protein